MPVLPHTMTLNRVFFCLVASLWECRLASRYCSAGGSHAIRSHCFIVVRRCPPPSRGQAALAMALFVVFPVEKIHRFHCHVMGGLNRGAQDF